MWSMIDWKGHFEKAHHAQFLERLYPVEGANWSIQVLPVFKIPFLYLSSRPEWSREITTNWLQEREFPSAPVICAGSIEQKVKVASDLRVTIAIEDHPFHAKLLNEAGITTIMLTQPWNLNMVVPYRALGWTHLMNVLETFYL